MKDILQALFSGAVGGRAAHRGFMIERENVRYSEVIDSAELEQRAAKS